VHLSDPTSTDKSIPLCYLLSSRKFEVTSASLYQSQLWFTASYISPQTKAAMGKGDQLVVKQQPAHLLQLVSTKPASKTKHLSAASCCNCGVVISEDTKALQYERCIGSETWKCAECMNISSELYDQLVSDSSNVPLRWFCDSCDQVIIDSRNVPSTSQDKLDNLITLVERLVLKYENFEIKVDSKCDVNEAAKLDLRISKLKATLSKLEQHTDVQTCSFETRIRGLEEWFEQQDRDLDKKIGSY